MGDFEDLQVILDALPMLFFQKDAENNILRTNQAAARSVGTTVESLVGTPTTQWFPDEAGLYYQDDLEVMRSGKPLLGIIEPFQVEGDEKRWISTDKYPHTDASGNVDGILVFIQDVTEKASADQQRIALEAQMQETQKLEGIGVLAAGVAHDFNNYLMSIMGNAEMATTLIADNHAAIDYLSEITKVSRQAAEICDQLLTYAGKTGFQLQPTNLSELIREISRLVTFSISKKIKLVLELADNLPSANVDSPQINQILVNLVTNASEAIGDDSGQITITTSSRYCDQRELLNTIIGKDLTPGHYVSIEVKDSGCGMTKDTLNQIFQPFYTTKTTGRGLGLATVLGSIRSQSGTLKATSNPNEGTRIELLFPATDDSVGLRTPPAVTTVKQANGTILLADDEESVRAILQTILEGAGYAVLTAVDGIDAIERFGKYKGHIKAAVLDHSMPGKNGVETYAELKRLQPTLPVLFSSGYPEEIAIDHLIDINNVDFIQKPYSSNELLWKLHRVITPSHQS